LVKLGEADTLAKQKAFFQFRYVNPTGGELVVLQKSKQDIDAAVGKTVTDGLAQDTMLQITYLKDELELLPHTLKTELEALRDDAIKVVDLSDQEARELGERWDENIAYNADHLAQELLKLKSAATTKKVVYDEQ